MSDTHLETPTSLQDARSKLERAFRVKFERDPSRASEQTLILLAAPQIADGKHFRWVGTNDDPNLRFGLSEEEQANAVNSDILAIEADETTRAEPLALAVQPKEPDNKEWMLKITEKEAAFCRLRATGLNQVTSYYRAGYNPSNRNSAYVCASLLEKRSRVALYLRKLKESAFLANVLSLAEKRSGLADAWRTPVGDIDENHPLAQEVIIKEFTDKNGNVTGTEKKVKMVNKIDAMRLDAQLAGELKESNLAQTNVSLTFSMDRLESPAIDVEAEVETQPE